MQLFDKLQASHFCSPMANMPAGTSQSLPMLHRSLRVRQLSQGTPYFVAHQASLLNSVERWILYAISNYRRSLDMLIPCAAPWSQVTLYYSSYFAANAILGMFGGWVHPDVFVDVESGVPTAQVLRVKRNPKSPNGLRGSHKVFWDFFYEGANLISPWAPPSMQGVLMPVNQDRTWLIKERNDVNYDTFAAFNCSILFDSSFKTNRLHSIRGPLGQQLVTTEGLLRLAVRFANDLNLSSLPFGPLGAGAREDVIRKMVNRKPPRLADQSTLKDLLQ